MNDINAMLDTMELEYRIEHGNAIAYVESAILRYNAVQLMNEDAEKEQPKIIKIIQGIFNTIINYVRKAVEFISDKVGKLFGADSEENQNKRNDALQFFANYNYEKQLNALDNHMSEGAKLLQQHGLTTEAAIKYSSMGKSIIESAPQLAVTVGKAVAGPAILIFGAKNYENIAKKLGLKLDNVGKKMDKSKKDVKGKNPEAEKTIATAMANSAKKYTSVVTGIFGKTAALFKGNSRPTKHMGSVGGTESNINKEETPKQTTSNSEEKKKSGGFFNKKKSEPEVDPKQKEKEENMRRSAQAVARFR